MEKLRSEFEALVLADQLPSYTTSHEIMMRLDSREGFMHKAVLDVAFALHPDTVCERKATIGESLRKKVTRIIVLPLLERIFS
jgi:hypothetical protein